ncbi:dATP/dGTP diphosphohydrolase domain-containing protein [Desulfovibrio oxyclinae]|uniref:dATP/dGTP diphosphohydrolase domain-containing protein n=1 Tax=Desulfovibrio oxyclinae TaxID=63560 RepID=UPI00036A996A|nr:dATP/dGTP diphosphohydrolase domain-containing protein [Desulfovibrio oxyclinae]
METVIWKSCDNCADKDTYGSHPMCKGEGCTSGCWLADATVHRKVSAAFDKHPTARGFKIVPILEDASEETPFPNPAILAAMGHTGEKGGDIKNSDNGVKFDNGKPRTDLLPPEALLGMADLYAVGARKYADRNWEKGMFYTRLIGALLRHTLAYMSGENYAADDKQHHMLSAAWCAFALFTYDCRGLAPEWDDRPGSQACPAAVAEVANLNNREVVHANH